MGRLNAAMVRGLTKPGRYGDGGTLFLNIAPGGSKSWIQRVAIDGKRHDIGLGGFPLVTLREAREAAFENRRLARRGDDPLATKRRARAPTFREAAERTFEANRARWRNNKTTSNWLQGMAKRVLPVLGEMRVDAIGREDVLRILTPIWTGKRRSRESCAPVSAPCSPGRRLTATSRSTSPARPSTAPCRRCRPSRGTSGRCRIPRSPRRSTSSQRRGRRCPRRRVCGSSF